MEQCHGVAGGENWKMMLILPLCPAHHSPRTPLLLPRELLSPWEITAAVAGVSAARHSHRSHCKTKDSILSKRSSFMVQSCLGLQFMAKNLHCLKNRSVQARDELLHFPHLTVVHSITEFVNFGHLRYRRRYVISLSQEKVSWLSNSFRTSICLIRFKSKRNIWNPSETERYLNPAQP